jgi:hypothetical protein
LYVCFMLSGEVIMDGGGGASDRQIISALHMRFVEKVSLCNEPALIPIPTIPTGIAGHRHRLN